MESQTSTIYTIQFSEADAVRVHDRDPEALAALDLALGFEPADTKRSAGKPIRHSRRPFAKRAGTRIAKVAHIPRKIARAGGASDLRGPHRTCAICGQPMRRGHHHNKPVPAAAVPNAE